MRSFLVTFSMVVGFSLLANAQQMWGTGMYPAMQGCGYPQSNVTNAGGARGTSAAATEMDKITKEKDDLDTKSSDLDNKIGAASDKLTAMLKADADMDVASPVTDFLDSGKTCEAFKQDKWSCVNTPEIPSPSDSVDPKKDSAPGSSVCSDNAAIAWDTICKNGKITPIVCESDLYHAKEVPSYFDEDKLRKWTSDTGSLCKDRLKNLQKLEGEKAKLDKKGRDLEKRAQRADEKAEAQAERDERRGKTEACATCNAPAQTQSPKWWQWGIAGIADVANGLEGYFTQKHIADNAAKLGWVDYQSPSATSFGYPYALMGLYGSTMAGAGGGGFGCGMGVGGGMMNPYGMQNPYLMGGMNTGMMSPYGAMGGGMNPYGMQNPYGMMNPYGMSGGIGAGFGTGMSPFGYPGAGGGYGSNPYMGGGGAYMPGGSPWGQYGPNGLGGGLPYAGVGGGFGGGFGSPYGNQGGFGSPYGGGYGSNPYSMYGDASHTELL